MHLICNLNYVLVNKYDKEYLRQIYDKGKENKGLELPPEQLDHNPTSHHLFITFMGGDMNTIEKVLNLIKYKYYNNWALVH